MRALLHVAEQDSMCVCVSAPSSCCTQLHTLVLMDTCDLLPSMATDPWKHLNIFLEEQRFKH